jgi:hypothetical protein
MTQDARTLLYSSGGAFPQTMVTGYDEDTSTYNVLKVDEFGHLSSDQYIWDVGNLEWIPSAGAAVATAVGVLNVANARINPSTEETLAKLNGFSLPVYDYISLGYTSTNLTSVVYKLGGSSGTIVATLTLGYTGTDLVSVLRT